MSLFNEILVVPTTANRLPQTAENEAMMGRLLKEGFSAYTFLMQQRELDELYREHPTWPPNNPEIARTDLIWQLPSEVIARIFPDSPAAVEKETPRKEAT